MLEITPMLTQSLEIGDEVTWIELDRRNWWRRTMPPWLGGREHVAHRKVIIMAVATGGNAEQGTYKIGESDG